MRNLILAVVALLAFASPAPAAPDGIGAAPKFYGWRGNGTGLFPDANVPVTWSIVSTGPMTGLACAAGADQEPAPVEGGLASKWLVIGPFALKDGGEDFAKELLPGEASVAPKPGDKVGELEWTPAEPKSDTVSFWSVNALRGRGKENQGGLATTCLFAKRAGKLRAVVGHPVGMTVYVNGKPVYSDKAGRIAVGNAYQLSRNRGAMTWPVEPSFEFEVKQGWNRMTVKLVSPNRVGGWNDLMFMLRLSDLPDVKYERKNIAWETPLPDHGHGTPIVVGDRVFVTSEPDELICVDKNTGKVVWTAMNGYYDATPQAERDANAAFKQTVDPIVKELAAEQDAVKRWAVRKKLQDALLATDKQKYTLRPSEHLAAHFEIVGYSTTPVSDGKHVWVWTGAGVAACYDLDGKRVWIRRIPAGGELNYSASPAVIGGKFAVIFDQLYGLDAKTGEVAWKQPKVSPFVASLLSARIAGVDVFISQKGDVVRASDGKMLWANPHKIAGDTGWAPPVVVGDVMYLPWNGMGCLFVVDFAGCAGETWQPKFDAVIDVGAGFPSLPKVMGIDRYTAGSPLIHDGRMYGVDWCGGYVVVDLKTKKTLAYKELGLKGEVNYVAMPVAASCTLIGKHIMVMDNQGNTVVLEPGGECKVVARNTIAMQVPRDWAITTQEYTTYAPPVADGSRMYIRGERYLYCIGGQ